MEGQILGKKSRLGERQVPWLSHSVTHSLNELLTHSLCTKNAGARAVGCQPTFQTLHSTSQGGLSLEFVAVTAGRKWYVQEEGCDLSTTTNTHYPNQVATIIPPTKNVPLITTKTHYEQHNNIMLKIQQPPSCRPKVLGD